MTSKNDFSSLEDNPNKSEDKFKALEEKYEALLGKIVENSKHISQINEKILINDQPSASSSILNPVFQGDEENAETADIRGKKASFLVRYHP